MKKGIFLFLITFLIAFSMLGSIAFAEEEATTTYENGTYKATSNGVSVNVMQGRKEISLFTIPATYYFNILDTDGEIYYISYNDLNTDNLLEYYIYPTDTNFVTTPSDEEFEPSGFELPLILKADLTEDATYYKLLNTKFDDSTLAKSDTLKIDFIGLQTYDEKNCAFVKVEDTQNTSSDGFGYIEVSNLTTQNGTALSEYSIPVHQNSEPKTPTTLNPNDTEPAEPKNDLVRTILIIGIIIPAIIIIFLLFKPSGNKKNRYDYDRNINCNYEESRYDRPRSRYDRDSRDRRDYDRYDDRDRYYDDRDRYDDRRR